MIQVNGMSARLDYPQIEWVLAMSLQNPIQRGFNEPREFLQGSNFDRIKKD
jgi:hypothetical protein